MPELLIVLLLKMSRLFDYLVMCLNICDGMANRVDPDQTVKEQFGQVYSVCLCMIV